MEALDSFKMPANEDEVADYEDCMDELSDEIVKLEQTIQEIEHFYSTHRKKQLLNSSSCSSKPRPHHHHHHQQQQQDDPKAASQRMQHLISQFATILNQITHRTSLDVDDLAFHHSSSDLIAGKPKDLNSIRKRIEANDHTAYKHVRDIYSDVRSVLKDAMKFNDERSDAHVTAKTLMAKFEDKWFQFLPKIMQEDNRTLEEEVLNHAHHAKMANHVSNKLFNVQEYLNQLRELVLQRCRRMSTLEKRDLGRALTKLSADDLTKALAIVAEGNPAFQLTAEEVDLDIDAQSESTLWKLKYFIVDILQAQCNQSTSIGADKNDENNDNTAVNITKPCNSNLKRKRDTPDILDKPPKRKTKKVCSIV